MRYFFHIRHAETLVLDDEGIECLGLPAAQTEAFFSACDLSRAAVLAELICDASVEITDFDGKLLGSFPVQSTLH
jgi:hypothetical protein